MAGLLELWELLCQFPDVLGIHEIPSIDDLACSLDIGSVAGLQQQGGAGSSPTLAIIETVLQEAFDAAIDIAADASSDVKSRDLGPALPALKVTRFSNLTGIGTSACRMHPRTHVVQMLVLWLFDGLTLQLHLFGIHGNGSSYL